MMEVRLYNCKELPHFLTGIFLLLAKFPKEYPYKPPEIRFVTPVCIYYYKLSPDVIFIRYITATLIQ